MWNGAVPSLNASPATKNTKPNTKMILLAEPSAVAVATRLKSSVPVAPYNMEMPYNMKPDAKAPRMKYFMDASVDAT